MVSPWMPITANILLILMGLIFVIGGVNGPSRFLGGVCLVIGALSLAANTGVI